jgi:hypothetical protein
MEDEPLMCINREGLRFMINSGYLTMALVALAIAIVTFPTIWHRTKRNADARSQKN